VNRPISTNLPPLTRPAAHYGVNGGHATKTSNDVTRTSNDVTRTTNDVTRTSPASRTSQQSSLQAGIDESGIFSKSSSASSTSNDERFTTPAHIASPIEEHPPGHERLWSSMSAKHPPVAPRDHPSSTPTAVKVSSANGLDKRRPEVLSAPTRSALTTCVRKVTSDDQTATPDTLSLSSSLSISAGGSTVVQQGHSRVDCSVAQDFRVDYSGAVELQRIQAFYEDKIRRVLERLIEMLANELSPESIDEYIRITKPERRPASFTNIYDVSAYLDSSAVRDLLWDDITRIGLERLDVVCDVVRANDAEEMQGHLASIVETIDSLLALVAPVFIMDELTPETPPHFVGCECPSVSEDDVTTFNESRDFDIDIIYCDRETTTLSSDGHRSLMNALRVPGGGGHRGSVRERKNSSSMNSPSISPRIVDNVLISVHSPGPSLSVRLFHYCLRQDNRTERLRQLLVDSSCRIRELCLVGNHVDVVCCDVIDTFSSSGFADGQVSLFDGIKNNCTLVKLDLRLRYGSCYVL